MTTVARTPVRRKKALTTLQVSQIAHRHSISEKDGRAKKIHRFDIEMAIREALELAGVSIKDKPLTDVQRLALLAMD